MREEILACNILGFLGPVLEPGIPGTGTGSEEPGSRKFPVPVPVPVNFHTNQNFQYEFFKIFRKI